MKSKNKIVQRTAFLLFSALAASCTDGTHVSEDIDDVDENVLRLIAQSPGHTVLSRQSVIRFGDSSRVDSIRATGYIVPDERRTNKITARADGRIEKLYVKQHYQFVNKGDKLFEIYSPELTNAISEYLFLLQQDSISSLTAKAQLKLLQYGLTERQILSFESAGIAPTTVTFFSSYTGYVIPGAVNAPGSEMAATADDEMSGMNGGGNNTSQTISSPEIREGAYVVSGQTLFSINDAQTVIAMVSVSGSDQNYLKSGMAVTVVSELLQGRKLESKIELIEPALQTGRHFLVARVPLTNENASLKFNSLVTAAFVPVNSSGNAVPASCVYDLGKRKIVWVRSTQIDSVNVFTPRIVTTGSKNGAYIDIISGLSVGEQIALQAGTLVDRDGIINPQLP